MLSRAAVAPMGLVAGCWCAPEEVGVIYLRAYAWFVAALIWCLVLLAAAVRFT